MYFKIPPGIKHVDPTCVKLNEPIRFISRLIAIPDTFL